MKGWSMGLRDWLHTTTWREYDDERVVLFCFSVCTVLYDDRFIILFVFYLFNWTMESTMYRKVINIHNYLLRLHLGEDRLEQLIHDL